MHVAVAAASGSGGIGGGGEGGEGEGRMNGVGGSIGNDRAIGGSSSNAGGAGQADMREGRSGGGQHPGSSMGMEKGGEGEMNDGVRGHVTLRFEKRGNDALHPTKVEFDGTHITKDDLCTRAQDMIEGEQEGRRLRLWRKGDASRRGTAVSLTCSGNTPGSGID